MNRVQKIPGLVRVKNILVSVSDKTGIEDFVTGLLHISPELTIYSTGGTFRALQKHLASYNDGQYIEQLIRVSAYTGQPEMQGGLVKTLDYRIYLGLLSEPYNPQHAEDLERTGALYFDMVVVNLYPFSAKIAEEGVNVEDGRSHIDIGGPTMLRASAKNYIRVASVCDPADYEEIISELAENKGAMALSRRFYLAKKTFTHTAKYDAAIIEYLGGIDATELDSVYSIQEGVWR